MESPSSLDRRQAWAHSSRRWLTLEDAEPRNPGTPMQQTPPQPSGQDEVFMDGCSTGKIETWLQGCGSESSQDNLINLGLESLLKTGSSFEDDLSLGAEATALDVGSHHEEFAHCPMLLPPPKSRRKDFHTSSTPQQRLKLPLCNMGHSMASSAFSASTSRTASSVSDVLQMCAEDAEETLYQLGFGCEEPQVTARIPARFFTFPSQLKGINFRLFLESQLRRIREEDPSLSLASRFRQVEVLTAMANAFYSLYSHVSRTPLQKLAPPEFSFSPASVERSIGERFFGSVRSEPRSPVERLKDTVSKMCLYTGSRGSDSASPNSSPRKRNSLPDVVGMVLGNAKGEGGNQEIHTRAGDAAMNAAQTTGNDRALQNAEVKAHENVSEPERVSNAHKERIQRWSQSGLREGPRAKACLFKPEHPGPELTRIQKPRSDKDVHDSCSTSPLHPATVNKPADTKTQVAIITYDVICPHVAESVHQAPYCSAQPNSAATGGSSIVQTHNQPHSRVPDPKKEPTVSGDQPQILPPPGNKDLYVGAIASEGSQGDSGILYPISEDHSIRIAGPCRITVTGWEDDTSAPKKEYVEDSVPPVLPGDTPQTHPALSADQRYLSPIKTPTSWIKNCPKQANSFELEEVQSAGEEESTLAEQCSAHTLSVTAATPPKTSPLRGDSFQSDSSGYAEEDVQHSHALSSLTERSSED